MRTKTKRIQLRQIKRLKFTVFFFFDAKQNIAKKGK